MAADPYHYPPDLVAILVDTIPLLRKSKTDTVGSSAAVAWTSATWRTCSSAWTRIATPSTSTRSRARPSRVSTRRATRDCGAAAKSFAGSSSGKNFSTCWQGDAFRAQSLVAKVRQLVNGKDSFARR